jgi:hypothetical protein
MNRYCDYPKGSILLYNQYVPDAKGDERKILERMKETFNQRKDLGREYFEGNYSCIMKVMKDVLGEPSHELFEDIISSKLTESETPKLTEPEVTEPEIPKLTDPDIIIQMFIDEEKQNLKNSVVKSSTLYEKFMTWINKNNYKTISHKRFTSGLKIFYGLEIKVCRFEDGLSQGIVIGDIVSSIEESYFKKFITLKSDEEMKIQKVGVRYKKDSVVLTQDLKKQFEKYMKLNYKKVKVSWDSKEVVKILTEEGYDVRNANFCKSCGNESKVDCCREYSSRNRGKKNRIKHIELVDDSKDK